MEKIRAVYILLIIVLLSLVVALFLTVIGALAPFGGTNNTASQSSVSCLKIENKGFFMRVILANSEDRDLNYTYFFLEDEKPSYTEDNEQFIHTAFITKGSELYTGHFQYMDAEQIHDVTLLVYREGESEPLENTTCNFRKFGGNIIG